MTIAMNSALGKTVLREAYLVLKNALDHYLLDTEESGCENYLLDELVEIPYDEPGELYDENDPTCRAWNVKLAVIRVQKNSPGNRLPREGLSLWRKLLTYSREGRDAGQIYLAGDEFRNWVEDRLDPHGPTKDKNVFRKDGDSWRLKFKSHETLVGHSLGLTYLSLLLRDPNRSIPAANLHEIVSDVPEAANGSTGEILDAMARESYRQRLDDLDAEMEEAKRNNDIAKVPSLESEKHTLTVELQAALGLSGRPREENDAERRRQSVSKAVNRAIEGISKVHEDLGNHLLNSVSTGANLRYAPEQDTEWLT